MKTLRILSLAAVAAAIALAACSKEPAAEAGALAYVPVDTPYAFANLEPVPQATIDEWKKKFAPLSTAYQKMIARTLVRMAADEHANEPAQRAARALLEEFKDNASIEGIERLGLDVRGHWAIYGVGLVPVMRWQLRDPAAFQAFVGRVEQRYGEKLPTGTAGGHSYWRIGVPENPLAGILAVVGDHVVFSFAPATASEDLVERLLGLELPERSLADDNRIAAINAQYGFVPYGTGYFDVVRIAQLVLDEKTGIEQEFLAALKIEDQPTDAVCRAELLAIARNFPRATFGYTRFDAAAFDQTLIFELAPALVPPLKALAAPVPGLGAAGTAPVEFGMSLKVDKLKEFVDAQARAVAAAPWKCAELAELNQGFADLEQQLANPMAFAIAPVLQGFRVAMTEFTPSVEGGVPDIKGNVVIASPNPQSLIASARTFLPQLASLKVDAGAAPVALPAEAAPPGTPPVWLAASANALALAVGAGEETQLPARLAAPAGDPPPLFAAGYAGEFLAKMMEMAGAQDPDMSAAERQEMEDALEIVRAGYGEIFGRLDMSLVATDRGLELRQSMTFK
jgi:hypothetical protein